MPLRPVLRLLPTLLAASTALALADPRSDLASIHAAGTVLARAAHLEGSLEVLSPDEATLGPVEVTRTGRCSFTAAPVGGQTVTFHFDRLTRRVRTAGGQIEFEGEAATCGGPIGAAPVCLDGLVFDLAESDLLPWLSS